MISVRAMLYLMAVLFLCTVVSAILTYITKSKQTKYIAIFSGTSEILVVLLSFFTLNLPMPEIFPVDHESPKQIGQEIVIESPDGVTAYYTTDGSDPKYGAKYEAPFSLDSSVTVAARNKVWWYWSDIKTRHYTIETEEAKDTKDTPLETEPEPESGSQAPDHDETSTESSEETESQSEESGEVFATETHTPDDIATSVSLPAWDPDRDLGIDGRAYSGGLKVVISNMYSSLGSGVENEVTSRLTLHVSGEDEDPRFIGTIVLDQSMFGSRSSGTVRIIVNGEEQFSTGEIDVNTSGAFPFEVNYANADSILIETAATLRGSSFAFGIVNSQE